MTLRKALEFIERDASADLDYRGEVRDIATRDSLTLRREPETDSQIAADGMDSLLHQLAAGSLQEIDNALAELQERITDLQNLHAQLRKECARVQQEVSEYANVTRSAMQSTKIITESLRYWNKIDPNAAGSVETDGDARKLRALSAPSIPAHARDRMLRA
jgi:hypothetical protein